MIDYYTRYLYLRDIAESVYPEKVQNTSFEMLCEAVRYGFDQKNQEKVAKIIGISREELIHDLTLLMVGARMQWQKL